MSKTGFLQNLADVSIMTVGKIRCQEATSFVAGVTLTIYMEATALKFERKGKVRLFRPNLRIKVEWR